MTPSTSLSLATEIAIILRAQIPQYPPGSRNAEAFDEASKIVVREEKMRAALAKENEALRKDKKRLNWLQDVWDACEAADDVGPWERVYCASKVGASLRSAIDAARADAARERKGQP